MKNNDPCTFKNNENKILHCNDEYKQPRKFNIDLYVTLISFNLMDINSK